MSLVSGVNALCSIINEVTYGLDGFAVAPTVFQAFRSLTINPIRNVIESPRATWSASGERHCSLNSHNDIAWEMPMSGKTGAAGTAPAWDVFMLAAGFRKTTVVATSVTYRPNTQNDMTDTPSATVYQYLRMLEVNNAYLLRARGYRGNVTMRMTVGEEAVISGSGMALYTAFPTVLTPSPVAPTAYVGASCMVVARVALTVGAIVYPVESVELSSNWGMSEERTGEINGGTLSRVLLTRPVSGGRMGGSLKLVNGVTALQPLLTAWQSGAALALSATLTNGTDNITITAPALQFGQPSMSAEGIAKFDVPFFLNRGTLGDDELSIALT